VIFKMASWDRRAAWSMGCGRGRTRFERRQASLGLVV